MNSKLIFSALILGLLSLGCQPKSGHPGGEVSEQSSQPDSLIISRAWLRPAAAGQNSAAYLQIFNGTPQPDTLKAILTEVATRANVHESYEENGMMGMRPAGALALAPDSMLSLKPGGFHIMLMNLSRKLAVGDSVDLQLQFSASGKKSIRLPVKLSAED